MNPLVGKLLDEFLGLMKLVEIDELVGALQVLCNVNNQLKQFF